MCVYEGERGCMWKWEGGYGYGARSRVRRCGGRGSALPRRSASGKLSASP